MAFNLNAEAKTDLRVLIDVSGSMKKNDPNNLRVSALRLLIGIVPKSSKTGVWMFEKSTSQLIPQQNVTNAWKQQARRLAGKIHSRGQRTDIETAIRQVIANWGDANKNYNRHLILLSDGMIDVAKDPRKNLESRQKIISQLLPKLKHNGIKVHSIALSKHADHKLLKLLSRETKGWYEAVNNSKRLHRTFLTLFENTTKTDKVPLKNNRFQIDKSISDMTLLVFKDKTSPRTMLINPDNKKWSYKNRPEKVKWFSENNYDLITVRKPKSGSWQLHAKLDADNRVMVITNLKLKTTDIAQHLLAGDIIKINTWLEQKDKKISTQNFLKLVGFKLHADGLSKTPNILHDDGLRGDRQGKDGIYHARLSNLIKPGAYTLTITAKSPTFERILVKNIRIHADPVKVRILEIHSASQSILQAVSTPGLFKQYSLKMKLIFSDKHSLALKKNHLDIYEVSIPTKYNGQTCFLEVIGHRANQSPVVERLSYVLPKYKKKVIKKIKKTVKPIIKTTPKEIKEKVIEPKIEKVVEKVNKKKRRKKKKSKRMIAKVNWGTVTIGVIVANIFLIGLGVFFFLRSKRKPKLNTADIDMDNGG